MSNSNKIAVIIILLIILSIPTWFNYENEDLAWLITDASRLIRISVAVLGLYFLTNIYHLKVAILGYFMATLTNVLIVFLSDNFVDLYGSWILYVRIFFLFLAMIFFGIYLKDHLKIFFVDGKNN